MDIKKIPYESTAEILSFVAVEQLPLVLKTFYIHKRKYLEIEKIKEALVHSHPPNDIINDLIADKKLHNVLKYYIDNYLERFNKINLIKLFKWSIEYIDKRYSVIAKRLSKISKKRNICIFDQNDVKLLHPILTVNHFNPLLSNFLNCVSGENNAELIIKIKSYLGFGCLENIIKLFNVNNSTVNDIFGGIVESEYFYTLPYNVFIYLWRKYEFVLSDYIISQLLQNLNIEILMTLLPIQPNFVNRKLILNILNAIKYNPNHSKIESLYAFYNVVTNFDLQQSVYNKLCTYYNCEYLDYDFETEEFEDEDEDEEAEFQEFLRIL